MSLGAVPGPAAIEPGVRRIGAELLAEVPDAPPPVSVARLYVNRGAAGAMVGRRPFGGNRLSGTGTKAEARATGSPSSSRGW